MKIKNKTFVLLLCSIAIGIICISACKKDPFVNPYDDASLKAPSTNPNANNLDPSNFAYLHANIFKPTCANSGCHDGTFPPDYRTLSSAYNTLVYQKPVNTANGIYRYRVFPFNADSSILFHRLNVPMGAGLMPLVIDPQSDWINKKNDYILAIKNWINAGAKDMFGNYPHLGNKQPQINGFLAYPAGNTTSPYTRSSGIIEPIEVPANSSIDLWFLVSDDSTLVQNISYKICKMSASLYDFSTATSTAMVYTSSGLTGTDFSSTPTPFTHKTTISTTGFPSGTYLYIRAYIDDGSQGGPTEIPNAGTSDIMRGYFALKIQ